MLPFTAVKKFIFGSHKTRVGTPPGTMERPSGKTGPAKITLIRFNEDNFEEKVVSSIKECDPALHPGYKLWINIDGTHDVELLEEMGEMFRLHTLLLEDITQLNQRPKIDDYDDHIYLVMKMIDYNPNSHELTAEQVSFILGDGFVISVQEYEGDIFSPNRNRLRAGKGRIRRNTVDYFMYTLIDTLVDHYYVVLERIGDRLENLENYMITRPKPGHLQQIYALKNDMIFLRKSVWPVREVLAKIEREDIRAFSNETGMFLRDVYDHTIQVIDTVETFRDMLTTMMDLYLNSQSNRMNEVMKVLTVIATIFIPLTFLTGVYGMNFEHMPELQSKAAYPAIWVVFIVIIVGQVVYYKMKKWL